MTTHRTSYWTRSGALAGLAVAIGGYASSGCGAARPSQQLTDSRQVVHDAERSVAPQYAPDQLLTAQQLLEKAETQDPGSAEEIHYAYLADRQARLAMSRARTADARKRRDDAQASYLAAQTELREQAQRDLEMARTNLRVTRGDLASVRAMLDEKEGNVSELEARKTALEAREAELARQLAAREAALKAEREARQQAEQRAVAAIRSLEEIAKVKEDANETVVTLSGAVLFRTNEATLLPIAQSTLDRVAEALMQLDRGTAIVVEGHTDSRGSTAYNQNLSQQRAEAVRGHLVGRGVDPETTRAVGKGEIEPVADNQTAEGRANNRRVEIVILHGPTNEPIATR